MNSLGASFKQSFVFVNLRVLLMLYCIVVIELKFVLSWCGTPFCHLLSRWLYTVVPGHMEYYSCSKRGGAMSRQSHHFNSKQGRCETISGLHHPKGYFASSKWHMEILHCIKHTDLNKQRFIKSNCVWEKV